MIQWEQLCSVDFVVYLRACATFSSETAEIRVLDLKTLSERDDPVRTAMFCRFWGYLFACATFFSETAEIPVLEWKTLSERDNPVRTAMFFRFCGVSTCVCIFLLRNSGNTGSWLENPIRERWSSESSFVLSSRKMFRWENDFVPAIPEWTAE